MVLRDHVIAAKRQSASALERTEAMHRDGVGGLEVCRRLTDSRDEAVLALLGAALGELGEDGPGGLGEQIALVAHGGYGRRELAPYSDLDLMLLHAPGAAASRVARLADRIVRDVFDSGLTLGHSVRTPRQACELALGDPQICTSLVHSRLVWGRRDVFEPFLAALRRQTGRRRRALLAAIERERGAERMRYGETVYLLEPNVKRSRGALRDLQLIGWLGFLRHAEADWARLAALGALSTDDVATLERAREFLLWLRNELHFHARQASDVLSRAEQWRIADRLGFAPAAGMLPVEQFMREYFRHTGAVNHVAGRFMAAARSRDRAARWVTLLVGHGAAEGLRVGPAGLMATTRGRRALGRDLAAVVRLVELANLYDVPIAPSTWEVVRREAPRAAEAPSAEAYRGFLSFLSHPARLGPLLRDLHDAAILERFIPEFAPARGLLQFNQYHKYTVDEHCIRAVEAATEFSSDDGPLGRVYRSVAEKPILHLALLLHDLGKGYAEDHRERGAAIARRTAERFGLPARQREALELLVRRHMVMNHLALRRDTSDPGLVVHLAVQIGSPELLRMLYVLTAADLAAVGPGVWDGWKSQILTDLYHRTMQHLAGESPATTGDEYVASRRDAVRARLGGLADQAWFASQIESLPIGYLTAVSPQRAAEDLALLRRLQPGEIETMARFVPDAAVIEVTVATSEAVAPGIFHRLTGALSSLGLEIRSAEIHTLGQQWVLDRFSVRDPDYAGQPPGDRFGQIDRAIRAALRAPADQRPSFRRVWRRDADRVAPAPAPTRVLCDNSTSDSCTIIDVFTHDRPGLLYDVTRALFELGLSVWRAKVGTHLDQVVDVFYVTDAEGQKMADETRLAQIRHRLLRAIAQEAVPHTTDR